MNFSLSADVEKIVIRFLVAEGTFATRFIIKENKILKVGEIRK